MSTHCYSKYYTSNHKTNTNLKTNPNFKPHAHIDSEWFTDDINRR